MCRIDYADDDDGFVFDSHLRPVAAWRRKCADCRRQIQMGERYHRLEWVEGDEDANPINGGASNVFDVCAHCETAARWLTVTCNGFIWTQIVEELREHWDEDTLYRTLGLGRLVIYGLGDRNDVHGPHWTRLPWTRPDGTLVPLTDVERWVDQALAETDRREAQRGAVAA